MCTHTRSIRNKYTGKSVRVACGKCESCLQEKALSRANRIRLNSSYGKVALFVTLTYDNDYLPYVRRSELCDTTVMVYRRKSVRKYRDKVKVDSSSYIVDQVFVSDLPDLFGVLSPVKFGDDDCIGVCYYPDFKNFVKRLRINLKRHFNYDKIISYYGCSEYGSVSKRPHFHALIFVDKDDVEVLRSAIVESWPFADKCRTENFIEVAKDASSYVASYVNSPHSVTSLYSSLPFRQKHSFSKGFGCNGSVFSLRSVVEKIQRGDLQYRVQTFKDGVPCVSSVPVPQYVINRYFPKFKGYSLLSDSKIRELLLRTKELAYEVSQLDSRFVWSKDDEYHFYRRLISIRKVFCAVFNWDFDRFAIYYPRLYTSCWSQYKSLLLKNSYDMVLRDADWSYFYENNNDLVFGIVRNPYLIDFFDNIGVLDKLQLNPNKRDDIVNKTLNLQDIYFKMDKSKRVVNRAMSDIGYNV